MENEYILSRIFNYAPYREWILLETVTSSWHNTLNRRWRSVTALYIESDLYGADDSYPAKLGEKEENEICMVIKRCGPYLTKLHLAPVNVRKPFFRNVRRFTARYELSERVLHAVCQHCTKLEVLDLSYHIFPTWACFRMLEKIPATVQVLLLEICRLDEPPSSEGGMKTLMNTCFSQLPNLRVFSLWGSCYGYWTLSQDDLQRAPSTITYLDLSQGFAAKIGDLRSWISGLINLKQLHLERTSINDDDLHALVDTCQHTLRGLTLAYAKSIIDFSPIALFSQLKYLRLDGNRDFLNDNALTEICRSCASLQLLSLENCSCLTAYSLENISKLRSLRHLSICSILSFTDACLAQICVNCPHLRSLQLKYCRKLTIRGLVNLCDLPKLRHLGVSGLSAFDQSIAECLRRRCTKLHAIEAFNCENYH